MLKSSEEVYYIDIVKQVKQDKNAYYRCFVLFCFCLSQNTLGGRGEKESTYSSPFISVAATE